MEHWNDRNRLKDKEILTFLNKLNKAGILDKIRKGQIIIAED